MKVPGSREVIELNGEWNLAFDPEERTSRPEWIAGNWSGEFSQKVAVPGVWNLVQSDAPCVGYYYRTVDIPDSWDMRAIHLHGDGATYRLELWVNGVFLGSHEGAYSPFCFDISSALRFGAANELVIRVASLSLQRSVDGMVLKEMPVAKHSWHYAEGGIWGSVWLESVSPVFVESIAIEPNLHRKFAAFDITLANTSSEATDHTLQVTVINPRGAKIHEIREMVSPPPGSNMFHFTVPVAHPLQWSCDVPDLYEVQVELIHDGSPIDRTASTFGMRDFTVKDGQFSLNGEPIFVRGVLLQPNYPAGLAAPLDNSMLETEVRLAKDAGFNMIRVHLRPAVPGLLDLTDRLGMLVYAESSLAWIQESPRLLDHGKREVHALIERDRNHPSVVIWGIFNEHRGPSARYSDALIRTARELDATRVIIDNSGGSLAIDQDFGWIDRATVVPDRSTTREKIQDIHIYAGAPLSMQAIDLFASIGSPVQEIVPEELGIGSAPIFNEWQRETRDYQGQIFVSEIGCGGMADLDEMLAGFGERTDLLDAREYARFRDSFVGGFYERELDRVFGSRQELIRQAQHQQAMGNRRQIEALLTNPRVSGYTVTQMNDLSCEFHAGLLNIWREPKAVYHETRRLQQSRVLILGMPGRSTTAGATVEVMVTLVDSIAYPSSEFVDVAAFNATGTQVFEEKLNVPAGKGVKHLGSVAIETGKPEGMWRITVHSCECPAVAVDENLLVLSPLENEPTQLTSSIAMAIHPTTMSEAEWLDFLALVRGGKTGIVGDLKPGDRVAKECLSRAGFKTDLEMGVGSWLGCYHWTVQSPLFAGLPSGRLAGEEYAEVLPHYVLPEQGGEVLAGTLTNTQTRVAAAAMLWYSDIEVVNHGNGTIIFCQYRIFDETLTDPLGIRLRNNLVQFASALESAA